MKSSLPPQTTQTSETWVRMTRKIPDALLHELLRSPQCSDRYRRRGLAIAHTDQHGPKLKANINQVQEMAVAMHVLSGSERFKRVESNHGVSSGGSVTIIVEHCVDTVCSLETKHISFPTGGRMKEEFTGCDALGNLPACTGMVDGSQIQIIAPDVAPSDPASMRRP